MPAIETENPLLRAAEAAARELEAAAAAKDFGRKFTGMTQAEAVQRWAGSAIILKNGEYAVVPIVDPVSTEGGALLEG